jgi:hypothetical protein
VGLDSKLTLCSSIRGLRFCGSIGLMEMTRSFTPEQFAQGLESWQWASVGTKTPLFTSPFGDVFFRAEDGFWWLDTLRGSLTRAWANADTLKADLATASGQDRYLLAGLAFEAERQGLIPAASQVYGFKTPPALGGALDIGNVEPTDFVVSLNLAGQIHEQIRNLPPGTRISGLTINGQNT